MTRDDLDGVLAIEEETFSPPWSRASYESELESPVACYLVLEDEEILGYAGMWMILDEGHITTVAIAPKLRGDGYGKLLLHAIMTHAEHCGVKRMTLEVRRSNKAARSLYERSGFVATGERKGYYEGGEDAVIYWRGGDPNDHTGHGNIL